MTALSTDVAIGVIGAGTMGAGIAQVAAQAGHSVFLYDEALGAAEAGRARLAEGLEGLARKGKLDPDKAKAIVGRIKIVESLSSLAGAGLVVEAIVERLDIKQKLFADLEAILPDTAILGTNTSSISVTSIGAALGRPQRLVGMHFFNPAPVMKLVEVVSGVATSRAVADTIHATATAWGKVAVHTRSTPGFIVNRVARAFYGEPMRLLEEGVADIATMDALLKGAGFRMGPFELMDLIGNDVNFAVSKSVFEAFFHEPRFRPSLLQQELVNAGRFGRKSGAGWYEYMGNTKPDAVSETAVNDASPWQALALDQANRRDGVLIEPCSGPTAADREAATRGPVIVLDLAAGSAGPIGFAASPSVDAAQKQAFRATLAAQGLLAVELPDQPGLVVLRTLSLIANEAFEAVLQGVADAEGIDAAMVYGVNYPKGPIAWARAIGLPRVLSVLTHLQAATGDMRYRPSIRLRQAARQ